MHSEKLRKACLRVKRAQRVRNRLHGTRLKPRLSIFKSNKHLAVQLIDDDAGITLAAASTYAGAKDKAAGVEKKSKATAERLGQEIAAQAQAQQIKGVVFDRGRYKYHGLLAALADAVRAAGIHL
jgi:large subunit ribosomal protein L18